MFFVNNIRNYSFWSHKLAETNILTVFLLSFFQEQHKFNPYDPDIFIVAVKKVTYKSYIFNLFYSNFPIHYD